MDESVNAFIVRSVNETLARDNENKWFFRVAVLLKNEQNPLYPAARYAILETEKRKTTAHKGVDLDWLKNFKKFHPALGQNFGVVFLCQKHYLINVKTNVSNARMNIPKAMRSLKSKCFISTTPILCRIEVSHPVLKSTPALFNFRICRLCTSEFVSFTIDFSHFGIILLNWRKHLRCYPRFKRLCRWKFRFHNQSIQIFLCYKTCFLISV